MLHDHLVRLEPGLEYLGNITHNSMFYLGFIKVKP